MRGSGETPARTRFESSCEGEYRMIALRELVVADAPILHAWFNDPETVLTGFSDPVLPQSVQRVEQRIRRWLETPDRRDYVILDDGEPIGIGQIYNVDYRNLSCELGVVVGNKQKRGKGIGREVLTSLVDFAFNQMNLRRCAAKIIDGHIPSVRLVESLGFIKEGVLRQAVFKNGQYWDIHIYALLNPVR